MISPGPVDLPNLDETIVRAPEDVRRDLAVAASHDLFAFSRGVLRYRDVTEGCHGPLCAFLDTNESRFKLVLMPRGHFKTSVATISRVLQRVCQNTENRILLANETATNAERFLGAIKAHCESNKIFRALYSHILPRSTQKGGWSNQELVFNREGVYTVPSIDTIGMTGAMTSRHYTHITFDDPISQEAAKSKLVMDDTITRISTLMSLMDDPNRDTIDLIGTRWAFYDVYSYFMSRFSKELAKFIRGAIEDGEPIFPERFTLDTLALIRNDPHMGEYMFSCLYMNNPRNPEVQDFNVEDLRFWRWSSDEEHIVLYDREGEPFKIIELAKLDITVTVDVRYGEKLDSDRDAIVTAGTTEEGDAIILDAWGKRATPLQVVDKLIQLVKRFNPRCIGIQKVGYEMSLKWHFKAACEREGVYATVVPVKPGGPDKTHIRGLQPVAATGHLYILPTMHTLRQELAEYPLGQYDDVADAAALQLQLWRGLLSQERMENYRKWEERILRSTVDYGVNVPAGAVDAFSQLRPDDRGQMPSLDDLGIDIEDHRYGKFEDFILDR